MPLVTTEERVGTLVVGKYRLHRILGEGGMGVVYAGENEKLRRPVAVKFLLPALASNASVVARFLNEARTASSLRHPNVVDVLDVDSAEDGAPFMVMELLEGQSFASLLAERGRLSAEETWRLLGPAMEAVAIAHERGVVHRDLKPDNVFVHRAGGRETPKVLDFGIAKVADGTAAGLTATGTVMGTAVYMAPEQARAQGVGPWSDVWATGVIWFQALTGRLPYEFPAEAPPTAVLVRIVTERPARTRDADASVPPAVADVVDRALAHEAASRYRSMGELHRAMAAAMQASPVASTSAPSTSSPRPATPIAPTMPMTPSATPVAWSAAATAGEAPGAAPRPGASRLVLGMGAAALLAVLGGAAVMASRGTESHEGDASTSSGVEAPQSVQPHQQEAPPPLQTGRVVVRTDAERASLRVNGETRLDPVTDGASFELAPGAYRFELRSGDATVAEASATVQAGQDIEVSLRLPVMVTEVVEEEPVRPARETRRARRPEPEAAEPARGSSDESPIGAARQCAIVGDNACVIRLLAGRARTEPELGLLIEAYRARGRTADASQAMRQYVSRFPSAPRAAQYRQILAAQGGGGAGASTGGAMPDNPF